MPLERIVSLILAKDDGRKLTNFARCMIAAAKKVEASQ